MSDYRWSQSDGIGSNYPNYVSVRVPIMETQGYTQYNNIIYYYYAGELNRYSMNFPYELLSPLPTPPINTAYACLASDNNGNLYLGFEYTVHIYSNIHGWNPISSPLFHRRLYASCIVYNDQLFVVGTRIDVSLPSSTSIEVLNVSDYNAITRDIKPELFRFNYGRLNPGLHSATLTIANDLIYITGGIRIDPVELGGLNSDIQVLNPLTQRVTLMEDIMFLPHVWNGVIYNINDNRLYSFMGGNIARSQRYSHWFRSNKLINTTPAPINDDQIDKLRTFGNGYPRPIISESPGISTTYTRHSSFSAFNSDENSVYFCGGEYGSQNTWRNTETYRFNITSRKWSQYDNNVSNNIVPCPIGGYMLAQSAIYDNIMYYNPYNSELIYLYNIKFPYNQPINNTILLPNGAPGHIPIAFDDPGNMYIQYQDSSFIYSYSESKEWKQFTAAMFYPRRYQCLTYLNGILYNIGGETTATRVQTGQSIEYISVSDYDSLFKPINPTLWNMYLDKLISVRHSRCLVNGDLIYVLGGVFQESYTDNGPINIVAGADGNLIQIINTIQETVTLSQYTKLPHYGAALFDAHIGNDNRIYIFGGRNLARSVRDTTEWFYSNELINNTIDDIPETPNYLRRWSPGYPEATTALNPGITNTYAPEGAVAGFNRDNNLGYILGGSGNDISHVYRFNFSDYTWTQYDSLTTNDIIAMPNTVYALGGDFTQYNNVLYYMEGPVFRYGI